jgi:hypothetical protein
LAKGKTAARVQPICQSEIGPELGDHARDVITPMPIAPWALNPQDIEHSD